MNNRNLTNRLLLLPISKKVFQFCVHSSLIFSSCLVTSVVIILTIFCPPLFFRSSHDPCVCVKWSRQDQLQSVHTFVRSCLCTRVCSFVRMLVCTYVCVCMCVYLCICVYICDCVYAVHYVCTVYIVCIHQGRLW